MHDSIKQNVFTYRKGMAWKRVNMHNSSKQYVFTCIEGIV